jgi:hypothetical protein
MLPVDHFLHRSEDQAQDLRLTALPDLYGGIAENAANRDVTYADFLEDVLKAERDARRVRSREILTRTAYRNAAARDRRSDRW